MILKWDNGQDDGHILLTIQYMFYLIPPKKNMLAVNLAQLQSNMFTLFSEHNCVNYKFSTSCTILLIYTIPGMWHKAEDTPGGLFK